MLSIGKNVLPWLRWTRTCYCRYSVLGLGEALTVPYRYYFSLGRTPERHTVNSHMGFVIRQRKADGQFDSLNESLGADGTQWRKFPACNKAWASLGTNYIELRWLIIKLSVVDLRCEVQYVKSSSGQVQGFFTKKGTVECRHTQGDPRPPLLFAFESTS